MNIRIDSSFEKDTDKIKDKKLLNKIADTIELIIKAENLTDIGKIEKLKGYKQFYKLRVGDFRAGIRFKNNTIFLIRFLHRKDIYKSFPKK